MSFIHSGLSESRRPRQHDRSAGSKWVLRPTTRLKPSNQLRVINHSGSEIDVRACHVTDAVDSHLRAKPLLTVPQSGAAGW